MPRPSSNGMALAERRPLILTTRRRICGPWAWFFSSFLSELAPSQTPDIVSRLFEEASATHSEMLAQLKERGDWPKHASSNDQKNALRHGQRWKMLGFRAVTIVPTALRCLNQVRKPNNLLYSSKHRAASCHKTSYNSSHNTDHNTGHRLLLLLLVVLQHRGTAKQILYLILSLCELRAVFLIPFRSISRRPVALPQSPARSPPITQENSSIRSFSPMANANPTLLDPLSPLPSRTSASSNPAPGLEASTERPGRRPSAGYSQPSSPIWPIQGDTSSVGIRPRSGSWRNPARVSNDSYIQRAPSGVAAAPQQAPLSSPPPAYSTIDSFNPVTATESDLWPTIHSAFNGCSATHKLLDRKRSTLSLTFTTKNAFVSPPSSTEAYGSEGPENMRVRLLQTHVGGPSRLAKPNKNLDNGLDTNGNLPGQTVRSRTQPTAGRRLSKTASQNQATSRRVSTSAKKTYGGIPQTTTSRTVTDVGQSLSQLPRILISSDSRLLFTLARPDRLEIWDADSGKEVTCHTVPDMNPGTALLHPSGEKLLFELVNDGRIIMWDTLKGKAVHSIVPSLPDGLAESYRLSKQVFDLSPNGRRLAVLQIWEQTLAFGEDYRAYMSFVDMDTKESLGRVSIPVEQDRQNQIWAPGLHAVRREDTGETHALGSAPDFHFRVMFTPESQHVLVTMRSSVFLVNPGIQRQAKRILQRQSQCITFIAPVLNHVVFSTITDQPGNDSTNRTGTVTVWDMASPQAVLELIHPFNVLGCAISSDGTLALTASSSMVVFWDLRDRLPIFRASTKSSISTRYTPCEFAGNTTFFVTYHVDGTKVWDVPQGYLQRRGQRRDTRYWLDLGFHCRQVQAPSSFPSGRVMADTIPVSWA